MNMNSKLSEGNRNEQKGKLKQRFAALTDDDQMFAEGKDEEVFGKQQIKLANTKEVLMKIVSEL